MKLNKGKRISNFETDIYSTGVVHYKLIARCRLWEKYSKKNILKGDLPELKVEKIKKK